jgi:septal ring factor EnvC (AmiA/AmiB activator)
VRITRRVSVAAALILLGTLAHAESIPKADIRDPTDSDQTLAEHELSRIAAVITALERELRSGEADRTQASRDLESHERAIAQITRAQAALSSTADTLTTQLGRLRSSHAALSAQIRHERAQLARELRVAYAMGRGDRAQLLLQRRNPGDIARLMRYHSYFTRAQRERIVMLERSLTQLSETEAAITTETGKLASIHARHQAQREALERTRDLRAAALVVLNAELADHRAAMAQLKKDQQRLSTLIRRLRDAINDVPAESEPPRSFEALRGKLPWPVPGNVKRGFGSLRDGADLAMQGVLVNAPRGHAVRAIAHGRVVFADWLRGFGLMIIIDHGDGYMSLYGHNQSLLREPGEWVSAGDALASVGDSGGKIGPGLYFEIRHDGRPENPAKWCSRRAKFATAS